MDNQDLRDDLCKDLAELFGALPQTNEAATDKVRLARTLIPDLIGEKLDRLQQLGLAWR